MSVYNNKYNSASQPFTGEESRQTQGGDKIPSANNGRTFNLLVDKIPYTIKASAFTFNGETRFYVSINGGDDHVFTWDSEISSLRAIDNNGAEIPDVVERAISQKLQTLK